MPVTTPDRFELIAPLPSSRRHLHVAVDRGSHPPRAVVLALYPRELSDDPGRLGRLCGEMERAAQLFHPNVVAPVGIEAVGDDLAAVTVWREAITLREILDAAGPLPADIAARIAADVCAGLGHAHGRPEPVVHGLLRPEAVLVDESGTAAVSGFGMPGGSGISDDLLGVAELLHECLVGEPLGDSSVPLDESGVPVSLAAALKKACAAEPEVRHPTADALGAALAQAVPLADRQLVAAYLKTILPAGSGLRAERRKKIEAALAASRSVLPERPEEISEHDIVGAATPVPGDVVAPPAALAPAPRPVEDDRTCNGTADPSGPSADRSSCASASSPACPTPTPTPISTPDSMPVSASTPDSMPASASTPDSMPASASTPDSMPASASTLASMPASASTLASTPVSASTPASTALPVDRHPAPVHHERSVGRGPHVSLGGSIAMCLAGVLIGLALARLPPWNGFAEASRRPPPEMPAPAQTRASDPIQPAVAAARIGAQPPVPARGASAPAPEKNPSRAQHLGAAAYAKKSGMGVLEVTAPEGAEVWLDGRRVGNGDVRRQVPEGNHRVEVRHRGAVVGERFQVAPGETWTYAVTPQ